MQSTVVSYYFFPVLQKPKPDIAVFTAQNLHASR